MLKKKSADNITMEKLILIATLNMLPGCEKEIKEATIALAAETRKETGSELFLVHTRNDSPQTIIFYEVYQSEEAFNRHKDYSYTKTYMEFLKGKIKNDRPEITYLTKLAN